MKEQKIKISIIVPVYNVEKYIERCINSLVDQSFKDYEIVVVDDETPDGSMAYVYEMQKNNNNIVICHRKNGGLSAARNTGINVAKGEYLFFCDSDDAIAEDCLQTLYDEVSSQNLDMILFDFETIAEYMDNANIDAESSNRKGISTEVVSGSEMLCTLVRKDKYMASACSYMVKKEILNNNHILFYEGILHEDELFTPVVMMNAKRVVHKNWLIYKRYVHPGSIMTSASYVKRMKGLAVVIKELTKYYDDIPSEKMEKKAFEEIIKIHIKNFLGICVQLEEVDDVLRKNMSEVKEIIKSEKFKLGMKFRLYIIYLLLKKRMGLLIA